jgi:putative hemolysin
LPTVVETKGEFVVAGETSISEVESLCGIDLPDGEYQTVSGFVQERLGRMPVEGDSFSEDSITVTVLEVCDRRVVRLSLRKRSGESDILTTEELSALPPQAAFSK